MIFRHHFSIQLSRHAIFLYPGSSMFQKKPNFFSFFNFQHKKLYHTKSLNLELHPQIGSRKLPIFFIDYTNDIPTSLFVPIVLARNFLVSRFEYVSEQKIKHAAISQFFLFFHSALFPWKSVFLDYFWCINKKKNHFSPFWCFSVLATGFLLISY